MYKSIMFYMGQKELEMKYKINLVVAQYRQRCEAMQQKFTEKLEQVHTAYQKMGKRCQIMQQEIDTLTKDKQELQEKYAEKSR
jgi:E3 ubiquitin-protein ligase CCNP1IP1